jgi:hypothetical protein
MDKDLNKIMLPLLLLIAFAIVHFIHNPKIIIKKTVNSKYRFIVYKSIGIGVARDIYLQRRVWLFMYKTVSELHIDVHKIWNPFGMWLHGDMVLKDHFMDGTPTESWDIESGFNINNRMDKMYSDYIKENNLLRKAESIIS